MRCIEKTLYTNGRIVTMDAAGTVAEAVLVAGNVIEAVGSKDGLAALAGPGCRTVDLKGASLYPGFIDTHSHASLYAMWKTHCRCPGIAHLEDVYPLIRKQAEPAADAGRGRKATLKIVLFQRDGHLVRKAIEDLGHVPRHFDPQGGGVLDTEPSFVVRCRRFAAGCDDGACDRETRFVHDMSLCGALCIDLAACQQHQAR